MHLHKMLKSSLLLLSGTALYAAPVITLNTTIPSEQTQIPHAICQLKNGGYLIGGTDVDSIGSKKGLLIRTDGNGKKNGSLNFQLPSDNEIIAVTQTFDGNYAVCGYVSEGYYGSDDLVIMKLDTNGNRIWKRELGFGGSDRPLSMIQTTDSGFVIAGYSSGNSNDTTATLLKLNKTGVIEWYRIYTSDVSSFRSVKQTHDGGFILTGHVKGCNAWRGGMDAFLYKVNNLGRQQWYKAFGGCGDEVGYSVDMTLDGGYVLAGSTTSFGNGLKKAFIVKTDSVGNYSWHKTIHGKNNQSSFHIAQTNDSNFIIGIRSNDSTSDCVPYLLKIDNKGDSLLQVAVPGLSALAIDNSGETSRYIIAAATGTKTGEYGIHIIAMENRVIKAVTTGDFHTVILDNTGTVSVCGLNRNGQLGTGDLTNRSVFTPILSSVESIEAGGNHSLFLKCNNTLWGCGENQSGQLGIGSTIDQLVPVKIMDSVKTIAAGGKHTMILKENGTLWVCGNNAYGQLGDGTTISRTTPVEIMGGVKKIAAGAYHSMILKENGELFVCGSDSYGQMGNGVNLCKTSFEPLYPGDVRCEVDYAGNYDVGMNFLNPTKLDDSVIYIAAGSFSCLYIKKDSTLWGCGSNYYGEFGVDPSTDDFYKNDEMVYPQKINHDIKDIKAGLHHCMFTRMDLSLWTVGCGDNGRLGDGKADSRFVSRQIMTDVKTYDASHHSVLVRKDGSLWTFGNNGYGQLGDSSNIDKYFPVNINLPGSPVKAPVIEMHPESQVCSEGAFCSFSVMVSANPYATFQWKKDSYILPNATSPILILDTLAIDDQGKYTVIVSNTYGSVECNAAFLTVIPLSAPVIINHPVSQTVDYGTQIRLSANARGNPSPMYQWKRNNHSLNGQTSQNLTIRAASFSDTGIYSVVVSNSQGSVESDAVRIFVHAEAPTIKLHPQSQMVNPGDKVMLSTEATGLPAPRYQWKRNSSNIEGATDSKYLIERVLNSDVGKYTVVISNSAGTTESDTAVLKMNTTVPVILVQPQAQSVYINQSATFSVTAAGFPEIHYQWLKDGSAIPGADSAILTIDSANGTDSGMYSVIITNNAGSVQSIPVMLKCLTATPPVILIQPQSYSIPYCGTCTLSVVATGDPQPEYQWLIDGKIPLFRPGYTSSQIMISGGDFVDEFNRYSLELTFIAVLSNPAGKVESNPVKVTIGPCELEPAACIYDWCFAERMCAPCHQK